MLRRLEEEACRCGQVSSRAFSRCAAPSITGMKSWHAGVHHAAVLRAEGHVGDFVDRESVNVAAQLLIGPTPPISADAGFQRQRRQRGVRF